MAQKKTKKISSPTTKLDIILKDGSTLQINANVVPHIAGSVQRPPVNLKSLKNWDCLWGEFPLADDLPKETETSSVELLIGNDFYLDIILPQKIEVQKGLYMLGSKLGWILSGRTSEITYDTTETNMLIMTYGTEVRRETSMLTTVDESLPLKPNFEDFWRLESIGIKDSAVVSDNSIALEKFNKSLNYKNGRYSVTLPWKNEKPELPENRTMAVGRLKSLVRRMKDNPDLIKKYDGIIEDQLTQGINEKVTTESKDTIKHYIPHHAVINPTKATTKVRIVYDASAKTKPEQLLTLLKESEAVVNSRPLTYVGDDINSCAALTPAHFLSLNPQIGLPTYNQDDTDDDDYNPQMTTTERIVTTWKKGLKHLDNFWRIWREDYLLNLRERSQRNLKESRTQSPLSANVGDVILLKDDLPRGMWRMGRIHELVTSRDGQTRSAKIQLPNNKIVGRPLNLLYPVECSHERENGAETGQTNEHLTSTPGDGLTQRQQPRRESAIKAMAKIKKQL